MSEQPNEIPGENFESMLPADADAAISKTLAEAAKDKTHPYTDAHHFQHRKAVERMSKLYEVKNRDALPPMEAVFQQGLEQVEAKKAEHQETLRTEAEKEMAILNKFGYDNELPEDLQPFHVQALKQERLLREGNFAELHPLLEKDLAALKWKPEVMELFRSFARTESPDEKFSAKILYDIIEYVYQSNLAKYKPPKAADE